MASWRRNLLTDLGPVYPTVVGLYVSSSQRAFSGWRWWALFVCTAIMWGFSIVLLHQNWTVHKSPISFNDNAIFWLWQLFGCSRTR
jgi:hypothetical protein